MIYYVLIVDLRLNVGILMRISEDLSPSTELGVYEDTSK
jgi:hypothetical protein